MRYVGDYELLAEQGSGGMGVVYRARQLSLNRLVAVKMIRAGLFARAEELDRFRREAKAAGALDHPHIVPVYEINEHEGQPYFSMKLVEGGSLEEAMGRGEWAAPRSGTRAEVRAWQEKAAGLVASVAGAVHHAHQRGVLHRDLKPSNVLLDERGEGQVCDFGLARLAEGAGELTGASSTLGTPGYMAPEQVEGRSREITTGVDVYGLGAVLYALLTGQPPHRGESVAETLRRVAEAEVRPPRSLNPAIDPDLETICLKCLEKEPGRRYASAAEVAQELERFLDGFPIVARPPGTLERFRKSVRRNRLAYSAAAAAVMALALGTAVSTWQAVRAVAAQREAVARAAAERAARDESDAMSEFIIGVFQSSDPARDGRSITVAETLDKAVKRLETDFASQPALRARIQSTLGGTYQALGLFREAIPLQEKARDYYMANAGPEHTNTLRAIHNLASSYDDAGRRDEALKLLEDVVRLYRKVSGPEHLDTLMAMNSLAISYDNTRRRADALRLREEVLRLRRKVSGPEHLDTLMAMSNLAISYEEAAREDEALSLREEVLRLRRKVLSPEHPATLKAMHNLAVSYHNAGRADEALKLLEETLDIRRRVLGPEHPDTLGTMGNLATAYYKAGRRNEAVKLRDETVAICRRVLGPDHPDTIRAMNNLAPLLYDPERRADALKRLKQVLAIRRILSP